MFYKKNNQLWPDKNEQYFSEKNITPICQKRAHCIPTLLAMLTDMQPKYFHKRVNKEDPLSWSKTLEPFDMKLAFCSFDIRKIKFYIDELIEINDLFLLSYYDPIGHIILYDPDQDGWICGSHVVILYQNTVFDPIYGTVTLLKDHECIEHHTKWIFRVIPKDHKRGL